MKLKCTKCGKVVRKNNEVFDRDVKMLGIDPEDYKIVYQCRNCRLDIRLNWIAISKSDLPEWFLSKYKDKIDWSRYLSYHKISDVEKFVKKYKLKWKDVLRHKVCRKKLWINTLVSSMTMHGQYRRCTNKLPRVL
jgi:hypothetical protein